MKSLATVANHPHPARQWLAILHEAGLSQTKAAHQMGISVMTLNRIMNGHCLPTAAQTVRFAEATGSDADALWQCVSAYQFAVARKGYRHH